MVKGIDLIIIRAEEVDGLAAFYTDALGLPVAHQVPGTICTYTLPGGLRLEIAGGGKKQPAPADRKEARQTLIFVIDNLDDALAALSGKGAAIVNQPFVIGGSKVAYLADPEGNVFGVRQPA